MHSFVVAKAVIVNAKNEVLLLRRSKTDERRPGQWDFPGGWVDEGEAIEAAVRREAQEEAGIALRNPRLVFGLTEMVEDVGSGTWLAFVDFLPRTPTIQLSYEHDAYQWVPTAKVLSMLEYHRWQKITEHLTQHNLLSPHDANA